MNALLALLGLYLSSAQAADVVTTERAGVPGRDQGEVTFSLRTPTADAAPESEVTGRIGIGSGLLVEFGALRGLRQEDWKPSLGLRWQFAGYAGAPVELSAGARYRKGSLSEPDGEGEADFVWDGTFRRGRVEFSFNALGGSDLDGDTLHFEGHAAAGIELARKVMGGVEGESRWAVRRSSTDVSGEEPGELGNISTQFVGPFIQWSLGRASLGGAAGFSRVRDDLRGDSSGPQAILRTTVVF